MKIDIYKIYNDDMAYIGSSKNYKDRMKNHKSNCNNEKSPKYNYFIYQYIRTHGGWNVFTKEIIHTCDVADETEQRKVEQEFIKNNECKLNICNSYLSVEEKKQQKKDTHKQWYESNKDHIKETHKQWKEKNKDYYKQWEEKNKEKRHQQKSQKVNCPNCNKEMRKDSLSKHLKKKNPCKPK